MPEEINRVVTDHVSSLLFTPTANASANLAREGIPSHTIECTGDIMQDAFFHFSTIAGCRSAILERLGLHAGQYVLATVHRAENTDEILPLTAIFEGLKLVSEQIAVVCPLHPRTRAALVRGNLLEVSERLMLIEPAPYLDMLALEKSAAVIATDSGGVQKEAFFAGVPCVTLRSETEWTELVELGWNRLCALSPLAIKESILAAFGTKGTEAQPYGDGKAAKRIVRRIDPQ